MRPTLGKGPMAGAAAVVVGLVVAAIVVLTGDGADDDVAATGSGRTSSTTTSTVAPPTTSSTLPPETTTTVPSTTTTAAPARGGAWTIGPYQGVGVWIDVYDWTAVMTKDQPRVHAADIDRMADLGIQTLFVQTAHRTLPDDVVEPDRLLPLIERARARGMAVVAWHLPTLEDVDADVRRFLAAAALPGVDGLAVDIESQAVADIAERNRRLLALTAALRAELGGKALGAITPSAVVLQVLNHTWWPDFPWREVGQAYDVIVPMAYWTNRPADLRGEDYTRENIDRIRAATGRPDLLIHVAGGIADSITDDEVAGMVRASQAGGAIGASLYDWNTSHPAQWELLRPLRVTG